jgi:hypothetical protein
VSRHPDKEYSETHRAYIRGDEWARPPGSKPPIDPEDPFAGMETETDARGYIKFVVERDVNGKASIYYAYQPDGRLRKVEWEKEMPANPNLFGRFADIGRGGNLSDVLRL